MSFRNEFYPIKLYKDSTLFYDHWLKIGDCVQGISSIKVSLEFQIR